MARVRCPYGWKPVNLDEEHAGARTVKCPHPHCHCFFDTDLLPEAGPSGPVADPVALPRAARLTAPHECHQCEAPIAAATGMRRSTVLCPACGRKTSVYAVLHACPWCRTLLESPARFAGRQEPCPVPECGKPVRVPRDVLLLAGSEPADDSWYAFPCPSCAAGLQTRRRLAGEWAVCPACFQALRIPDHGVPAPARSASSNDTREAVQKGGVNRCACGMPIPNRSSICPYCGQRR